MKLAASEKLRRIRLREKIGFDIEEIIGTP